MKKLQLSQMEIINGSFDCSTEAQLAYIAGTGFAGAFGGPVGFLVGIYAGTAYSIIRCYN